MFEQFTDGARRALVLAQEEARLLNHNFIGTEHILLGLVAGHEGVAGKTLESLGVELEAVRAKVKEITSPVGEKPVTGSPPFTPRSKKVLELSLREALWLNHDHIGPEHLLLALIREGEGVAAQVLAELTEPSRVREKVTHLIVKETLAEQASSSAPGARAGEPPHCPRCGAGLADTARYRVLNVSDDAGAEPLRIAVVYCRQCGYALGTAS